MRQDEKPKRRLKRSDNVIPDYDYLFEGVDNQSQKKKNFFGKILKINRKPIFGSTLIYLLQAAPQWVTPILTANIVSVSIENLYIIKLHLFELRFKSLVLCRGCCSRLQRYVQSCLRVQRG